MGKLTSIFDGAVTLEIPDDFVSGPEKRSFILQRKDLRELRNTRLIRRLLFRSTYREPPRTCFYSPDDEDTRIVCSDTPNNVRWPSDARKTVETMESSTYKAHKNPHDVKTAICHDSNGNPLVATKYDVEVKDGIWYVLMIALPVRGYMAGITMKCTTRDVGTRWNQYLAAADSIRILEP
ncbi:hypothetical protein [Bifidobacterium sp. ESL0790]|uniref:hypothetical protein n=1 Tax=Bifidobacterium sp. ESL0790 TaxID=2983233 RepID=UPI0023F7F25D|nr:hypothetical protein [Bifidobacterium sp. ESL0790]WEV72577.1 hypothetical protein OZY47_00900 [Bifidobacterium sp. ESL0790]